MGKGSGSTNTVTQSAPPQQYLDAYSSVLQQAQAAAQQPLQLYQGQTVAGLSPDTQSGINQVQNAVGIANPYINAGAQYMAQANTPLWAGTQQFSPSAVAQYQSPYTKNVVDATQAQFNNSNAIQQQGVVGNAVSQGGWGGDRSAVAQALTAGQEQTAQAPVIAGLQNQGYSQALNEFNTQQQSQLGANEAQSWLASQTGAGMANLGNEAQSAALTSANASLGIGNTEQTQAQALLNVPYTQFQQQQAYPFQTTGWLANIAQGTGSASGGNSSTSVPGASAASQALGTGVGALGLYNAANTAGIFGAGTGAGTAAATTAATAAGTGAAAAGGASAAQYAAMIALAARGGRLTPRFASGGATPAIGMGRDWQSIYNDMMTSSQGVAPGSAPSMSPTQSLGIRPQISTPTLSIGTTGTTGATGGIATPQLATGATGIGGGTGGGSYQNYLSGIAANSGPLPSATKPWYTPPPVVVKPTPAVVQAPVPMGLTPTFEGPGGSNGGMSSDGGSGHTNEMGNTGMAGSGLGGAPGGPSGAPAGGMGSSDMQSEPNADPSASSGDTGGSSSDSGNSDGQAARGGRQIHYAMGGGLMGYADGGDIENDIENVSPEEAAGDDGIGGGDGSGGDQGAGISYGPPPSPSGGLGASQAPSGGISGSPQGAPRVDPWMSVAKAGFAMAAGRSRHALANIGAGAEAGINDLENRQQIATNNFRQQQQMGMLQQNRLDTLGLKRDQITGTQAWHQQQVAVQAQRVQAYAEHLQASLGISAASASEMARHHMATEQTGKYSYVGTDPATGSAIVLDSRTGVPTVTGQTVGMKPGQSAAADQRQQIIDMRRQAADQQKDAAHQKLVQQISDQDLQRTLGYQTANPGAKFADAYKIIQDFKNKGAGTGGGSAALPRAQTDGGAPPTGPWAQYGATPPARRAPAVNLTSPSLNLNSP